MAIRGSFWALFVISLEGNRVKNDFNGVIMCVCVYTHTHGYKCVDNIPRM